MSLKMWYPYVSPTMAYMGKLWLTMWTIQFRDTLFSDIHVGSKVWIAFLKLFFWRYPRDVGRLFHTYRKPMNFLTSKALFGVCLGVFQLGWHPHAPWRWRNRVDHIEPLRYCIPVPATPWVSSDVSWKYVQMVIQQFKLHVFRGWGHITVHVEFAHIYVIWCYMYIQFPFVSRHLPIALLFCEVHCFLLQLPPS